MKVCIGIPEEQVTKPVLDAGLEAVTRLNEALIKSGKVPDFGKQIRAGLRWKPEPPGQESFDHAGLLASRRWGDCDDIAPLHAATLRASGEDPGAKAVVYQSGPHRWHAVTERSTGELQDPSQTAGMRVRPGSEAEGIPPAVVGCMGGGMVGDATPDARPFVAIIQDPAGNWCARTDLPICRGRLAYRGDTLAVSQKATTPAAALGASVMGAALVGEASGVTNEEHLSKLYALSLLLSGCSAQKTADRAGRAQTIAALRTLEEICPRIADELKSVSGGYRWGGVGAPAGPDMSRMTPDQVAAHKASRAKRLADWKAAHKPGAPPPRAGDKPRGSAAAPGAAPSDGGSPSTLNVVVKQAAQAAQDAMSATSTADAPAPSSASDEGDPGGGDASASVVGLINRVNAVLGRRGGGGRHGRGGGRHGQHKRKPPAAPPPSDGGGGDDGGGGGGDDGGGGYDDGGGDDGGDGVSGAGPVASPYAPKFNYGVLFNSAMQRPEAPYEQAYEQARESAEYRPDPPSFRREQEVYERPAPPYEYRPAPPSTIRRPAPPYGYARDRTSRDVAPPQGVDWTQTDPSDPSVYHEAVYGHVSVVGGFNLGHLVHDIIHLPGAAIKEAGRIIKDPIRAVKDVEKVAVIASKVIPGVIGVVQGIVSLIPGIGPGVSAALAAAMTVLEGGGPLEIALNAALGLIPLPPPLSEIAKTILDALLALVTHHGDLGEAALAAVKANIPGGGGGILGQVFDTLAHIILSKLKKKATTAIVVRPASGKGPTTVHPLLTAAHFHNLHAVAPTPLLAPHSPLVHPDSPTGRPPPPRIVVRPGARPVAVTSRPAAPHRAEYVPPPRTVVRRPPAPPQYRRPESPAYVPAAASKPRSNAWVYR